MNRNKKEAERKCEIPRGCEDIEEAINYGCYVCEACRSYGADTHEDEEEE